MLRNQIFAPEPTKLPLAVNPLLKIVSLVISVCGGRVAEDLQELCQEVPGDTPGRVLGFGYLVSSDVFL